MKKANIIPVVFCLGGLLMGACKGHGRQGAGNSADTVNQPVPYPSSNSSATNPSLADSSMYMKDTLAAKDTVTKNGK